MNTWDVHGIEFAQAEGLQRNQTSVRVLDEDLNDDEQVNKIQERIDAIDAIDEPAELLHLRNTMSSRVKKDNGYKFIMMVAAFSKMRLVNLIHEHTHILAENDRWMEAPEITGTVQLSASLYGHIKEAEMIVRSRCDLSLPILMETPKYATPFARLVAIRMTLSGVLTGLGNRRDKSFRRLHQEQHLLLQVFPRFQSKERDWTRPITER